MTPRSDVAMTEWQSLYDYHYDAVSIDFARQLERELAAARQRKYELEASRDWWRGEYDAKALGLEHFQARNDELVALLRLCRTALCNMLEDGDLTDRKQAFGTMERIDRALEGANAGPDQRR
jgi:malate synthase